MHVPVPGQTQRRRSLTARRLAFQTLFQIEKHCRYADDAFDRALQGHRLEERDRALAFELVHGVLRQKTFLDWRLNAVSSKAMNTLPTPVVLALRLGAYQILCLTHVPHSAAVHETVSLAKTIRGRDWSGFVNAILRAMIRTPAPAWPDLSQPSVSTLALRYSCPEWLTQRWITQYGPAGAERACHATVTIPPLTCRTNTLKCTREELMAQLEHMGIKAHPCSISDVGFTLEKAGPLNDFLPLQTGACYVEDEAAQLIPLLLDVRPGHRVLDACAAPGGKTTHIAALMENQGEIIATDSSPSRLRILQENCSRLGVSIVRPLLRDYGNPQPMARDTRLPEPHNRHDQWFDRIVVDAPCSGLGVLGRHPEGKWLKKPEDLSRLQQLQLQILSRVSVLLRPGGVLVYSACSGEPEETRLVIQRFCQDHPDFYHETVTSWVPPTGRVLVNQDGDLLTMASPLTMDGFFASRLRKRQVTGQ